MIGLLLTVGWKKIQAAGLTALDTETTDLDPFAARLVGLSLAVTPGEAAYIPLAHAAPSTPEQLPLAAVLEKLRPWLEERAAQQVLQNAKYDQHVFANHGIALAGIAHDTMLQSYVLEAGPVERCGAVSTPSASVIWD